MTAHNTPEEKTLIKLIEKLPVTAKKSKLWVETIQESGLTEELVEEIRLAVTGLKKLEPAERSRNLVELAMLVRCWRMAQAKKQFAKH